MRKQRKTEMNKEEESQRYLHMASTMAQLVRDDGWSTEELGYFLSLLKEETATKLLSAMGALTTMVQDGSCTQEAFNNLMEECGRDDNPFAVNARKIMAIRRGTT
jgi:hypothetical protein